MRAFPLRKKIQVFSVEQTGIFASFLICIVSDPITMAVPIHPGCPDLPWLSHSTAVDGTCVVNKLEKIPDFSKYLETTNIRQVTKNISFAILCFDQKVEGKEKKKKREKKEKHK